MATEAARLKRKTPGKKKKNRLDTNRPSHGRTYSLKGLFGFFSSHNDNGLAQMLHGRVRACVAAVRRGFVEWQESHN